MIDEPSLYKRALSDAEIQQVYSAGSAGKCLPVAPSILTQPASQTVLAGSTAILSVTTAGTEPLSYQWRFNGSNIAGATGTSLTLSNVQPAQAGSYAVLVNQRLWLDYQLQRGPDGYFAPAHLCSGPCGSGELVAMREQCLGRDRRQQRNCKAGPPSRSGEVGQAFSFDGVNDYVMIPKTPSLDVGSQVTVEFWMKADAGNAMTSLQGLVSSDFYDVFIGGGGGLGYGVDAAISTDSGASWVTTAQVNGGGAVVSASQWHHVAATYDGTKLQLYIDGQAAGNPILHSGAISPMTRQRVCQYWFGGWKAVPAAVVWGRGISRD